MSADLMEEVVYDVLWKWTDLLKSDLVPLSMKQTMHLNLRSMFYISNGLLLCEQAVKDFESQRTRDMIRCYVENTIIILDNSCKSGMRNFTVRPYSAHLRSLFALAEELECTLEMRCKVRDWLLGSRQE